MATIKKVSLRDVMESDSMFSDYALQSVNDAIDKAKETFAEYGPRCPDYDSDCVVCQAYEKLESGFRCN